MARLGKVLAIAAAKGGTGKTTTAVNLAAALAVTARVTLADLDPQASATLALGQVPTSDPWTAAPIALQLDGFPADALELRPGGRALALGGRDQAARHVAGVYARTPPDVGRTSDVGYSVMVLDCPPGLTPLTLAALEAADVVLVPVEASPLALPGLLDIDAVIGSLTRKPILRVVLVRVNERRILTADVRERIRTDYGGALYRTEIPEDVRAAEAPGYGLPVTLYAPHSRAALAYIELARSVRRDLTGKLVTV